MASSRFGYDVSFAGVGSPQNALRKASELYDQFPHFLDVGYCTQIAIFTRSPSQTISLSPITNWGSLTVISFFHYPCNIFTKYPPDPENIASSLGGMWRQFRPQYQPRTGSAFEPSQAAKIYEGKYIQLQHSVVCQVDIDNLWDLSYPLQKVCRFDRDVYSEVGKGLDGKEFNHRSFMLYD